MDTYGAVSVAHAMTSYGRQGTYGYAQIRAQCCGDRLSNDILRKPRNPGICPYKGTYNAVAHPMTL